MTILKKRVAVYAGTFDPITNGHFEIIKRGAQLFDKLIIAVGTNANKKPMFSLEERIALIKETVFEWDTPSHNMDVTICAFDNQYLIRWAKDQGAGYLLRGIRNIEDYEYEADMQNINCDIQPGIETVFMMPSKEVQYIRSSMVKGLVGVDNWNAVVKMYVSESVLKALEVKYNER
jgi:pantetheine-phosphate adenylyltransferase